MQEVETKGYLELVDALLEHANKLIQAVWNNDDEGIFKNLQMLYQVDGQWLGCFNTLKVVKKAEPRCELVAMLILKLLPKDLDALKKYIKSWKRD